MYKAEQLLSTKFYIPPARPQLITRPRLLQQLNDGLYRKLTLISAPAGFGKTTLVSEWVEQLRLDDPAKGQRIAWLSLDENDNEPTRFLTYFIHSLKQVDAFESRLGESALAMLRSPQSPSTEVVLTSLINELVNIADDIIFILDDYHVIEMPAIDAALAFLLDHLPSNLHLVITSRVDPSLPLSRLRARGQVTELRAADLRFTLNEAGEFFQHISGLELSTSEIAALENRTEGWIAGLQLVVLSMQGREDIPEFINSFTGDHRYIVDYLVEEVLQRQPEEIRDFLLQTSILSRLNDSLCDAVTKRNDSNLLLNELGRANLFIVPLDNNRRWYRYHHLFRDVLRAHLVQEQTGDVPELHKRASEWCEQNGLLAEAICHSLTAKDYEKAAGLVEQVWSEMDQNRQSAQWLEWAKALPDEIIHFRPVLNVGYAWALLDRGELEAGEARLWDVEQCLEKDASETVVVDEEEFRFLPATIATARAYHALAVGNVSGTMIFTRQALDFLPEDEYLRRGTPAALLSLASWTDGDLETADQALVNAMASYKKAGNILYAITGTYPIVDIRITMGQLRQAFDVCQQAIQLAEGQADFVRWGVVDVYSATGDLYREMNDFEAAEDHLLKASGLGEKSQVPRWRYRWCLAQARLKELQGDLDAAFSLLEEAEANYRRGPMPDVRPVSTLTTRIFIKQNRLSEALGWVREQNLSSNDDLCFLREFDHITLARVLLAQYKKDQQNESLSDAISLLERLLKEAEKANRMGSMIEIRILLALFYEAQSDIPSAIESLEPALRFAEPEGYIRTFVDEGDSMDRLLAEANARGIIPEYVGKLLGAFGNTERKVLTEQPLIEPLSEREREILMLIATGLKNKEIAEQMVISLNTVLYHTKNIYNKLGVNRRTQAILKAQEIKLVVIRPSFFLSQTTVFPPLKLQFLVGIFCVACSKLRSRCMK